MKRVVHGGKICTNTNERDRLVLKWSDLMPGIVNDRRITFSDRRSFELFEARLSKGVMNNVTRETLDKRQKISLSHGEGEKIRLLSDFLHTNIRLKP